MLSRRHTVLTTATAVALQVFNGYVIFDPVSVSDIALVAALSVTTAYQLYTADGWLAAGIRPLGIPFVALTLWLAFAGNGLAVTQFAAFGLLILLVATTVRTINDIETVLWGALIGAAVASILTLFSIFVAPEFGGRVSGTRGIGPLPVLPRTIGVPIGSFGSFATYALAPVGWAVARYYQTRDRRLLAAVVVIIFMIVVHQTRATYLALVMLTSVLVVGLFGQQLWRAGWSNIGMSLAATSVLSVAGGIGAWTLYSVNQSTALTRFTQFDQSVRLIYSNPLTGVTPPIIQHFPVSGNIPHNVVLWIGVVGGVPAVVLLLTTFVTATAGLWITYDDESPRIQALGLGVAAGWAATLTSLSLAPGFTRAFWLMIALGAMLLCRRGIQLEPVAWMSPAVSSSSFSRFFQIVPWRQVFIFINPDASTMRIKVEEAYLRSTIRRFLLRIKKSIRKSRISAYLLGKS